MARRLVLLAGALFALATPAIASLSPNNVVVIYNSDVRWNNAQGLNVSRAVADYYCQQRGIPAANEIGLSWPYTSEAITYIPDLYTYILNDQGASPGLKTFLSSRPGFDINDPATDPTKAIVLCYGVPLTISGGERASSVDSALTLLFNTEHPDSPTETAPNGWGAEPIGTYNSPRIQNPYYYDPWTASYGHPTTWTGPTAPRTIPADFGDFRASTSNNTALSAPQFTICRMLDATHAIAGGEYGLLYTGVFQNGTWTWSAVPDGNKSFVAYDIVDINILDSQNAFASTKGGTILKTTNGGQTWTAPVIMGNGAAAALSIYSISFYDQDHGWYAGNIGGTDGVNYIRTYPGQVPAWGNLPSGFVPVSISATDANHAWVSGSSGIYYTSNAGTNWTHQYSAGATGRIWVKNNIGWALTANSTLLKTTDGSTWTSVSSPAVSGTDLAVCVLSNVTYAVVSGTKSSGSWYYDGSSWTQDSGAYSSVGWAGGSNAVGVSDTATLSTAVGSPGSLTWTDSHTVPEANWKMRYLVTRLDGFPTPVDTATGIPRDVKALIDRSVSSDGGAAIKSGQYIVQEWTSSYLDPCYPPDFASYLGQFVGASHVTYNNTNTYLTGQQNVSGYTSRGSYNDNSDYDATTFWRPHNSWNDGAIGFFADVSNDLTTLRGRSTLTTGSAGIQVPYMWGLTNVSASSTLQPYHLTVQLYNYTPLTGPAYGTQGSADPCWVGLYDGHGNLLSRGNIVNGVATIDLTSVQWSTLAATNYWTGLGLHFPNSDLEFSVSSSGPGMFAGWAGCGTAPYNNQATGIAYTWKMGQSLDTELIREGCSGTVGNVNEPYADGCPRPEVILPQYASGNTFAESAYMGLLYLGWQEAAVGDPLMAPYSAQPTVAFISPTPAEGSVISGQQLLNFSAAPQSGGMIKKVEFWVTGSVSSARLATVSHPPYQYVWDTRSTANGNPVYPAGTYTIQAVAYESGNPPGMTMVSRSVTVNNSGTSTVAISSPTAGAVVDGSTLLQATVSGTPVPADVQFRLYGVTGAITAGDCASAPYQCTIPTATTDGVYTLQAVGLDSSGNPLCYSDMRALIFVGNVNQAAPTGVGGLNPLADGAQVFLHSVNVSASGPYGSELAFYVEDVGRAAGIRVVLANPLPPFPQGEEVAISGTLHTAGTSIVERYIVAQNTWDMGTGTAPQPLGMSTAALGGGSPWGAPSGSPVGVTGGVGTYSIGLLARIWGKVTYASSNFIYLEDGCGLRDGNSLQTPFSISLQGGSIPGLVPYPAPTGIYVDCSRLSRTDLPGIGDYVSISGISSAVQLGDNIVRCLLPRSSQDITAVVAYPSAIKVYWDQHFHPTTDGTLTSLNNSTALAVGGRVRLVGAGVYQNNTSSFIVKTYCPVSSTFGIWEYTTVNAETGLSGAVNGQPSQYVTVIGTVTTGSGSSNGDKINADAVYLEPSQSGSQMGQSLEASAASAASNPDSAPPAFQPQPAPTRDDVRSSPWYQQAFNQIGAIGWALSQPDGTVITLTAEQVIDESYDGLAFTFKESFDPMPDNTSQMVLYLDQPIYDLPVLMSNIDITGTLATLSSGKRAIVHPTSVYVYTDATGHVMPHPWKPDQVTGQWQWKRLVAP